MEYVKIGDICTKVCSGGTPSSGNPSYYEGGTIPWLNTNEVNFCRIYSTEKKITQLGYENSAAKYIDENSVIVAMYGVTAGKSAIAKIRLTTNQACCNLSIDGKKADYEYVYYYLKLQSETLNKLANGGAQQNLNSKIIKDFKIPLPPLAIQHRIASILSVYDFQIENNKKRIKLLEQMAENLYKEWFVRFRFPGYENAEFEGGIPKGWQFEPIHKNNKCYLGGTPSRDKSEYWEKGDIPWINSGEINKIRVYKESEFITRLALEKSATKLLPIRSTLVAITGATVGQVSLNEIEVCANQSVVGIVNSHGYHCFTYFSLVQNINSIANYASGGAQQHINKDILEKFKVLSPEDKIIKSFEKRVTPYFDAIFVLLKANDNLIHQRDLLLPRLMSGKLSI